jgi:cell division protein FtsA
VIEPRVEEIFSLVHQVIRESGYEELLSSGIVITGGSAVMPGMVELGEDIFLKPVRKGLPLYSGALFDMVANPRSATVMGLLEEARTGARARAQGGGAGRFDEEHGHARQGLVSREFLAGAPGRHQEAPFLQPRQLQLFTRRLTCPSK